MLERLAGFEILEVVAHLMLELDKATQQQLRESRPGITKDEVMKEIAAKKW